VFINRVYMTIFDVFNDGRAADVGGGDADGVPAAPATGMPVAFSEFSDVSDSSTQSIPPLMCA
jgi:hypothetical protein